MKYHVFSEVELPPALHVGLGRVLGGLHLLPWSAKQTFRTFWSLIVVASLVSNNLPLRTKHGRSRFQKPVVAESLFVRRRWRWRIFIKVVSLVDFPCLCRLEWFRSKQHETGDNFQSSTIHVRFGNIDYCTAAT